MSRKEWILVAIVLVLGGVYVGFFSGWFGPKIIRVEHTVRSAREAWGPGGKRVSPAGAPELGNVSFSLHQSYKLTSVKVVAVGDLRTNKYPHALWQLTAPAGSAPVDSLAYGFPVAGMKGPAAGIGPEPLEPGVEYRLLVEAGEWKGARDFVIPRPQTAAR